MQVAKRRKVSAPMTKNAMSTRGIAAFTRVSKAQLPSKVIQEKTTILESSVLSQFAQDIDSGRKRKAVVVDEIVLDSTEASEILSASIAPLHRPIKQLPQTRPDNIQRLPQTPQKSNSKAQTPSPAETPTKGTRSLLEKLCVAAASPLAQSKANESQVDKQLPSELVDLINLHSSFLTALSLHYAHNGTHSPADLRILCPDVARAWGKRSVLLNDIRRILAILNMNALDEQDRIKSWAQLGLSDYGHGKICVEIKTGERIGNIARPLDENLLNDTFTSNLESIWEKQGKETDLLSAFINDLPLQPITTCSSLARMSPLLAKGQRRLEDMRAGITIKKENEAAKKSVVIEEDKNGRRPTLLERLQAKQLLQSKLPPPPSKTELDRNAALHRLEEVVSVLTLLTTSNSIGQQRVSFTMPTVLGKLKDSFKTPMSKQEGETCVRLLASDIAPEWLRIVKMGKTDAIIVDRDNRPNTQEIQERVKRAI
jgi:hypothetical protein